MRVRLAVIALLVCACAPAQQTVTLEQLLSFIRSSIKMKSPDRDVALWVTKLKLSEKLDDRTIEELQGEGAGPRTVAALEALGTASSSLPKAEPKAPPPPPKPIPPPSSEEQQALIGEVREYAMNYSQHLPDFICTQVTRKYVGQTGQDDFHNVATIMEHLTYFEQQEHYKVTMVNNRVVDLSHEKVGGASSTGDFGSMLRLTFSPSSDALIEFDHWGTLRGKLCYVFSYRINSGNSGYSILFGESNRIITAYRGLVYVDKETHLIHDQETHPILRLTLQAIEIPATFPVQEASETLDYGYQTLSGHEFLLPLKAQVFMRHDRERSRNDIEYHLYQKYSADAVITFDTSTPDALPEDQTKEQPTQPKAQPQK
jgi:hypothetical protein